MFVDSLRSAVDLRWRCRSDAPALEGHHVQLTFDAIEESVPGPAFRAVFGRLWPAYRDWFLRGDGGQNEHAASPRAGAPRGPGPGYGAGPRRGSGERVRPTPSLQVCRKRLAQHMPELVDTFDDLLELVDGDETIGRFLSCYQPPRYLAGCSQAVVRDDDGDGDALVRNYDLSPALNDGLVLKSRWHGVDVIATTEFLWGVADGMNGHGLALSLAFGGRRVVGRGFGLPLILRYALEVARDVTDALDVFERVPTHMAYNVTVLDRDGQAATVELAPDRAPHRRDTLVATNHQAVIDDEDYTRFTRSRERERRLKRRIEDRQAGHDDAVAAFLAEPVYTTGYDDGFGTLYTTSYRPGNGDATWIWPETRWPQHRDAFRPGWRTVRLTSDGARVVDGGEGLRQHLHLEPTGPSEPNDSPATAGRLE